jgi:hypothetical protein
MVFPRGAGGAGASMQARSCCSMATHPAVLYPAEAQHPVIFNIRQVTDGCLTNKYGHQTYQGARSLSEHTGSQLSALSS